MPALICGSFAYDSIMVFPGRFADQILPNQIHMLNVAFLVPEMRRDFGGCAGNIAYNLKLLGGDGYPMGAVGHDFAPYAEWMDGHGVSRTYLHTVDEAYTAQAYITTDMDDNQITAFHPGAMNHAHEITVRGCRDTLYLRSWTRTADVRGRGVVTLHRPGDGRGRQRL
jgi:adenosine kinase